LRRKFSSKALKEASYEHDCDAGKHGKVRKKEPESFFKYENRIKLSESTCV
jgi:hypothetical protein